MGVCKKDLSVVFLMVGIGLSQLACRSIKGDVPRYSTPGWDSFSLSFDPKHSLPPYELSTYSVLMRYSTVVGGGLLFTREPVPLYVRDEKTNEQVPTGTTAQFSVYRYVAGSGDFTEVPQSTWDNASGEIGECGFRVQDAVVGERKLYVQGREVPTVAPYAVTVSVSHDDRFAAVLSAEGPTSGGGLFLLDGHGFGARGQHYLHFLDMTTGEFLERVVRIPLMSVDGMSSCWAPDDSLVIYYNVHGIVFVPVLLPEG